MDTHIAGQYVTLRAEEIDPVEINVRTISSQRRLQIPFRLCNVGGGLRGSFRSGKRGNGGKGFAVRKEKFGDKSHGPDDFIQMMGHVFGKYIHFLIGGSFQVAEAVTGKEKTQNDNEGRNQNGISAYKPGSEPHPNFPSAFFHGRYFERTPLLYHEFFMRNHYFSLFFPTVLDILVFFV
jgi:hypothetical protein